MLDPEEWAPPPEIVWALLAMSAAIVLGAFFYGPKISTVYVVIALSCLVALLCIRSFPDN